MLIIVFLAVASLPVYNLLESSKKDLEKSENGAMTNKGIQLI